MIMSLAVFGAFPKLGALVGRPCNKDHTVLGSSLGSPVFGNPHFPVPTKGNRSLQTHEMPHATQKSLRCGTFARALIIMILIVVIILEVYRYKDPRFP